MTAPQTNTRIRPLTALTSDSKQRSKAMHAGTNWWATRPLAE